MALLPARDRDKYAIVAIIAAIGIMYAYYTDLWEPKDTELAASQTHVDSLVVLNQRAKSELAQGKTQELKAEAERFANDLEVMRRRLPTAHDEAAAPRAG